MPSRIDIGPEGGPFVAINENSNDLELQDINGNVIAKWDETAGAWDFQTNDLENVGGIDATGLTSDLDVKGNSLTGINAINASSANVDELNSADLATAESGTVPTAQGDGSLTMAEAGGGRFSNLLDETTATASELELSGFTASDFKIVIVELENLTVASASDSVKMRLDNDDSSVYAYNSVIGSSADTQSEFQIASPGDEGQDLSGQIELTTGSNGRSFITAAKIGWQDWRLDSLSQLIEAGGGTYSTDATSIQIFGLDGGNEQTVRAYGVE